MILNHSTQDLALLQELALPVIERLESVKLSPSKDPVNAAALEPIGVIVTPDRLIVSTTSGLVEESSV
jgi:hypothetical protein